MAPSPASCGFFPYFRVWESMATGHGNQAQETRMDCTGGRGRKRKQRKRRPGGWAEWLRTWRHFLERRAGQTSGCPKFPRSLRRSSSDALPEVRAACSRRQGFFCFTLQLLSGEVLLLLVRKPVPRLTIPQVGPYSPEKVHSIATARSKWL